MPELLFLCKREEDKRVMLVPLYKPSKIHSCYGKRRMGEEQNESSLLEAHAGLVPRTDIPIGILLDTLQYQ